MAVMPPLKDHCELSELVHMVCVILSNTGILGQGILSILTLLNGAL